MKYSQYIGIICCLALVGSCFLPWSDIPDLNTRLSGVNGYISPVLDYGKQVYAHTFFIVLLITGFLIKILWVKRANIFISAVNLSLSVKNFILFSLCREGICPERKIGLYLLILFAVLIQLMTLFVKEKRSIN
ncbi:MAG: hypothetical protein JWN76_1650 [Chitinophagaceae bacterium]|nr:hypothetical protein [Chitinophagaceae bacterium]